MTNTQRKAMQQALEALVQADSRDGMYSYADEIAALSQALVEVPEVTRLTDGEVWDLWNGEICVVGVDEMNQQEAFKFARAIEQAVRIK